MCSFLKRRETTYDGILLLWFIQYVSFHFGSQVFDQSAILIFYALATFYDFYHSSKVIIFHFSPVKSMIRFQVRNYGPIFQMCIATKIWNIQTTHTICKREQTIYRKLEKNKIVPSAPTQIYLEIIILSEISQTQKDKYIILLICGI